MPVEGERPDQRPYVVGCRKKVDGVGNGLKLHIGFREIRKDLRTRLRRARCAALEELAIAVDEPGQQDVDHVRLDRSAASRLVRAAGDGAFLDLEVAVVGDWLGDIEQQKIV